MEYDFLVYLFLRWSLTTKVIAIYLHMMALPLFMNALGQFHFCTYCNLALVVVILVLVLWHIKTWDSVQNSNIICSLWNSTCSLRQSSGYRWRTHKCTYLQNMGTTWEVQSLSKEILQRSTSAWAMAQRMGSVSSLGLWMQNMLSTTMLALGQCSLGLEKDFDVLFGFLY